VTSQHVAEMEIAGCHWSQVSKKEPPSYLQCIRMYQKRWKDINIILFPS
jgi:hypothetical protein